MRGHTLRTSGALAALALILSGGSCGRGDVDDAPRADPAIYVGAEEDRRGEAEKSTALVDRLEELSVEGYMQPAPEAPPPPAAAPSREPTAGQRAQPLAAERALRGRADGPMEPDAVALGWAGDGAGAGGTGRGRIQSRGPAEVGDMALDDGGTWDEGEEDAAEQPAPTDLDGRWAARDLARPDHLLHARPDRFLPRMFYFENTYLGGSAAHRERLLRLDEALAEDDRPYRVALGAAQPFDPPAREGLRVTAHLDAPYFEEPRRAFLQVGLQGSSRHGWRRPPLDLIMVLDREAIAGDRELVLEFVVEVLRQLGPADRLGVVVASAEPRALLELSRLDQARSRLARHLDGLADPGWVSPDALARAIRHAGALLDEAAGQTAIVPGTQTIFVVTRGDDAQRIAPAARAAHDLTVQGAVTSVLSLERAPERGGWWQVANQGHGNYHHLGEATPGELVAAELESISRVVARLVRVNVRLGRSAHAIRVLGTRVLDAREVTEVKEREVATDRSLSRAMGIVADRGDDDDGIQTVIPYFYGDDSHVILIELWLEGPGAVADVTVRYKDMVNLDNATARTSVRIDGRPRPASPEIAMVRKNVTGFQVAEALQHVALAVQRGDLEEARRLLDGARAQAAEVDPLHLEVVERLSASLARDGEHLRRAPNARALVGESMRATSHQLMGEFR